MVNIDDFRSFLIRELTKRQTKNLSYSMSAFARDLEMSPQKLSQVIKGRTGLSAQAAADIAHKINLKELERELFISLVNAKHSRSELVRKTAESKIKNLRQQLTQEPLSADEFSHLSYLHEWAIYLMVDLKNFRPDVDWIAEQLGLSVEETIKACEKLFNGNFLKKTSTGQWRQTRRKLVFAANDSTKKIRLLYHQFLNKAVESIEESPVSERHFHIAALPIKKEDYARLKGRVDQFAHEILEEFRCEEGDADRIYSVAIAVTPLDQSKLKSKS